MIDRTLVKTGLTGLCLAALLTLSACSSTDEKVEAYVEPDPGQSIGLEKEWSRSIGGGADEYFQHPGVIALAGNEAYVGTYGGKVARVSLNGGRTAWDVDLDTEVSGGVELGPERVFVGTAGGEMVALSRADGEQLWRVRVSTKVASAPRYAEGRIFFTTLDNRTFALDAKSGERLWVHQSVPEPLVMMGAAQPTVKDGVVYIGYSSGEVFALGVQDGATRWSVNLMVLGGRSEVDRLQDVDADLIIGDRRIFAVNHQGSIAAIDKESGRRLWRRKFSGIRTPLLKNGRLYVSHVDGSLAAVSEEGGAVLWSSVLSDGVLTAPAMVGGKLMVADDKGRLFAVEPRRGEVVGLDRLSDPVYGAPRSLAGNGLLLWTNDGNLIHYN